MQLSDRWVGLLLVASALTACDKLPASIGGDAARASPDALLQCSVDTDCMINRVCEGGHCKVHGTTEVIGQPHAGERGANYPQQNEAACLAEFEAYMDLAEAAVLSHAPIPPPPNKTCPLAPPLTAEQVIVYLIRKAEGACEAEAKAYMNSAVAAAISDMSIPAPPSERCTAPTTALHLDQVNHGADIEFVPKSPGVARIHCNASNATCSLSQTGSGSNPPMAPIAESAVSTMAAAMSPDQLRREAAKAYAENRLYAPAGNNTLEFYLALRDKQPDDVGASSALIDVLPMTVVAAEQSIVRKDFAEAKRLAALIERVDGRHPMLQRLKDNIVAHEARSNTASTASAVSPATSTRPLNAAPKVQFAPAPDYPPEERSKGIAGTTVLTLTLDAKGIVWEVEVAKSSGNRNLDQAAVNAARQWRFSPRIQGGARIASRIHVPITFR